MNSQDNGRHLLWSWIFLAILLTVSFDNRGEDVEPRGEYAVMTIPFSLLYCTVSSWTQDLSIPAPTMLVSARKRCWFWIRTGEAQSG